jgi:DNA-directed RNA polymerase subunit beta'
LPRVTELFEARRPKDPAIIAEIDGKVELVPEKKRGKRIIKVVGDDHSEVEHVIPHGKQLLVHANDRIQAGDALVRGPLVPHDILRVAAKKPCSHACTNSERTVRARRKDKHIEIVVAQMLRKVRVEDVGDTTLLPGIVIDKFEFRKVNDALQQCVRVTDPGDTEFHEGDVVPAATIEEVNSQVEVAGQKTAKHTRPRPATGSTQLLGITKAAVQSESFISAASFQETTKVLTEAALAGKVDNLVGLKENVILGHLVPAGTGFHTHQEAEVRIRPEALMELQAEKERILAARLDLLGESQEAASAVGTGE